MALGEIVDLSDIPFLYSADSAGGRFLASLTFYANGRWRMWMPVENEKYVEVQAWPAEASYFANAPEEITDFGMLFFDFIAQYANYTELMRPFSALQDDINNLSAAIAKLNLIAENRNLSGVSRMAATEVEYILLVCRSIFDLMQELLAKLWTKIQLTDPKIQKRMIRSSFADIALHGGTLRTAEAISEKFFLPAPLADCYARHAPVFVKIRQYRDNLVHRGQQVQAIFVDSKGFSIARGLGPFVNPQIWRDEEVEANNIVPLLPVLGLIIHGTLAACEDFASVFVRHFRLLEPIVPGMRLFMRGYFDGAMQGVLNDADMRVREGRSLVP